MVIDLRIRIFFSPCVFPMVSTAAGRWRCEAQRGFIPEAILLAAFEDLLAAQSVAPLVLDEVAGRGIRLRDELDFDGAIDASIAVSGARGFLRGLAGVARQRTIGSGRVRGGRLARFERVIFVA